MPETMKRSSLKNIKENAYVNLERALRIDSRLGGHIVSGHIDGTGIIEHIETDEIAVWYTIKADENLMKYIVQKGTVSIDGISLTVADVRNTNFKVSIIPHTRANTNLKYKEKGDIINIECDMIGKYIEKLLGKDERKGNITKEFLIENGFIE